MANHKPGDEPKKPKHTGELRNGRKSMIKNESSGDETLTPNEFRSNDR